MSARKKEKKKKESQKYNTKKNIYIYIYSVRSGLQRKKKKESVCALQHQTNGIKHSHTGEMETTRRKKKKQKSSFFFLFFSFFSWNPSTRLKRHHR